MWLFDRFVLFRAFSLRGFLNDLPRYIFVTLWMLTNIGLFIGFFVQFQTFPRYFYFRLISREGLAFARAPAAVINFNSLLILLPVCRNLISIIRGTCFRCSRSLRKALDKNISYHMLFAWTIIFCSVIHTAAHYYNYEFIIADAATPQIHGVTPSNPIKNNPLIFLGLLLNRTQNLPLDAVLLNYMTYAGVTGHIMWLVLFLMATSSVEVIRRSFFEIFWFTHHLFIFYFIALGIHQFQMILPLQSNVEVSDPLNCSQLTIDTTEPGMCDELPTFSAARPSSYKWFVIPLAIYLVERLIRFVKGLIPVQILHVEEHPSRTLEIRMKRKFFRQDVGQYIFVNIPSISFLEWHPFTLTSCPEDNPEFSVHIRIVGDWTEALLKKVRQKGANVRSIIITTDGPFGTASEDVFDYEIVMLVGAGIGVTPFASVLKSIYNKRKNMNLKKLTQIYFFWVCPQPQSFEWFATLLKTIEKALQDEGCPDLIKYEIYLTRGWTAAEARNIYLHEDDLEDPITRLGAKTNYGRPKWDEIFATVAENHQGKKVGVFFCGPPILSKQLHLQANKHSTNKCSFSYNKENF